MTVQGLVVVLVGGLQCTSAVRTQGDLWSEVLHSDLESESPSHYGIERTWNYGGYLRVNFTAESNGAPSSFTIRGDDAEHEVKWTFEGRKVTRSSNPARPEEAWGLLDQELAGETYIDFEKTHEKWEVSINGKRTPWFDYEEFTHWTVRKVSWSNVNLPKLSLFYRECNTDCDTAECKSCEHEGVPSATSACRAISATGSRQCETQPSAQAQCCRGAAPSPRFASLRPGNWVYMTSDDDLIQRGCPAFENDAAKCMNLKARTMRVLKTDPSTRKVELWCPDLPTEQNPVFVPVYLLEPKASKYETIVIKNQDGAAEGIQVNNENQYIWDVRSKAQNLNVPKHWYIHRINNQPFTPDRWSSRQGMRNQFTITVVDTESNIFDSCEDQSKWTDSDGDGCAEYAAKGWCNKRGEVTPQFKGNNNRCYLFFSCSFTMQDKRPKDFGGNIALDACCACGGGYFRGEAPTPSLTEPVTEAPSPALSTEAPPLVVPSPKAPKEVFLVGADAGYPTHMGHFELRVDKADETTGKAVYVNVHHHVLYWSVDSQKWTVADEKKITFLEAGEASVGDTPYEAIPEDGSLADWTIRGQDAKVDLSVAKSYSCGEKSDCNCPELDHECKATAQDLYCYPGQIMQPTCGTLAACCEQKPTCADSGSKWEDSCFINVGPKLGVNYCPLSGCTQEYCCGRTCKAECGFRGLDVNPSNAATVCPDEGCDRDFCCLQADTPAPTANPGNKQDIITCEECVTDDETQREVLQAQVTVTGLSYEKMVENYVVRSAVYDAVRKATMESVPDAGLTESQLVIHVSPGSVVLRIILMPSSDSLHTIKASILDANKTGSWKVNLEESLKACPNIGAIADSSEDEIDVVMLWEPQVKTAIHERRLQQDIDARGSSGSIWGSHASATFGVWGEFVAQHWYFFAAGLVVVGGVSFMAMRWLGNDDEDADVIG